LVGDGVRGMARYGRKEEVKEEVNVEVNVEG
jgi:hypothetical protein